MHHWPDQARGLDELARVTHSHIVLLTWDPASTGFWLLEDYFPEIVEIDRRIFLSIDELRRALGGAEVSPLMIPHDCVDGFLGAYWRRPQAYLDAGAVLSRPSPSSVRLTPGLPGSVVISQTAPGHVDTESLGHPKLILAIGSSWPGTRTPVASAAGPGRGASPRRLAGSSSSDVSQGNRSRSILPPDK